MIHRFGDCQLDIDRRELRRGGETVHVEPQVFQLLAEIAGAGGAVVSKEHLIETVWRGLNVSDATISARVNAARAAVDDDGQAQRVIRTVPKHGFALNVPLEQDRKPQPDAHAGRPRIRFARSADGELIAHARHGQGPPLVRVGHWLSHLELDWESPVWRPLLDRLGRAFTLVRYDQRGTGLSTRAVGNLTLDAFVADLLAVADANGLDRFPIFAVSQAVPVAVKFAARHPERVSRMVLYGGYAVGRIHREVGAGEVDEETMLGLIRAGWGREDGAFLNAFTTLFMPDATPEQVKSFVHIQNRSISPENAAVLRQAVDRFVVEDDLSKVRAPVLVAHARDDAIHPISQGRLLASSLPEAEFMTLDSRNHAVLPQEESWERLVNAITAFCTGR
jgi:pimeloyl-ACP methyl ester carboxylesterase